jgi:hypothetical protein
VAAKPKKPHMTIRVLEEGWRNQYERIQRSRKKLDGPYRSSIPYDDDFYHAVQDAWHLRDWIDEDTALEPRLRRAIFREAGQIRAIRIIADIANCTKHLVLRATIREHAAMTSTNSTVSSGDKRMTREIVVSLRDGSTHSGVALLDAAHDAWKKLLTKHDLL